VDAPRGQCLAAEVIDRRRDARIVDRRCLDDGKCRIRLPWEGGLEPVVDLNRRQVLRQCFRPGCHGLDRHERRSQREEHGDGGNDRDDGASQHTVEDRAPEAPALRPLQPVEERNPRLVHAVAELREQRRKHRQ
jgi:hypothetical protein